MKNIPAHFAIYTEDIKRAKAFYAGLFGWHFEDNGGREFMQIKADENDQAPIGALQDRKFSPVLDKIIGFECSIEVSDIDETQKLVETNNGKILMPKN